MVNKHNIFSDFTWERDGNGDYAVTYLRTGLTIIAKPRLGNNKYCIAKSEERETNYYGQSVPKMYTKFEVMDILRNLRGDEIICA